MTRPQVLREFGGAECIKGDACRHIWCRLERALADEVVRLRKENETLHQQKLAGQLEDRSIIHQLRDGNARLQADLAELRGELERVQTESADAFHHRDGLPPYPSNSELLVRLSEENDRLQDELVQQSITLRAEHQRAERILAALREPSEAVLLAAARFDTLEGLRAAVAAAEQEVDA